MLSGLVDGRVRLVDLLPLHRLSQGSVALEMLSHPLYFWVSNTGGLGVFLPPGVCLKSTFTLLTQTETKKPDKQGAVGAGNILAQTAPTQWPKGHCL